MPVFWGKINTILQTLYIGMTTGANLRIQKSADEWVTDIHNKSIVGKGAVWYKMSYEEAIKEQMQREAQSNGAMQKEADEEEYEEREQDEEDEDENYDDDDLFCSILVDPGMSSSDPPVVNGTESSRLSDAGMFEN